MKREIDRALRAVLKSKKKALTEIDAYILRAEFLRFYYLEQIRGK